MWKRSDDLVEVVVEVAGVLTRVLRRSSYADLMRASRPPWLTRLTRWLSP